MMKSGLMGLLALAVFGTLQAEVKLAEVFPAGVTPDAAVIEAVAPDVAGANLIYVYDLKSRLSGNPTQATYLTDKSAEAQPFKTVGYLVYLVGKDGKVQYVYTTMDAFTDDAKKIGVPTFASGAVFQQPVKNLTVKSNVDGVKNGAFAEGNIEFWPNDYGTENKAGVAGADDRSYDFGDMIRSGGSYGSMQVHNTAEKQTVFAYNQWRNAPNVDLGIGNNTNGNPDWTFRNNADQNYANALLFVFTK